MEENKIPSFIWWLNLLFWNSGNDGLRIIDVIKFLIFLINQMIYFDLKSIRLILVWYFYWLNLIRVFL